jgi:transposase
VIATETIQPDLNFRCVQLEEENAQQKAQIVSLRKQVDELYTKVAWYEEQLRLSAHRRFGTSSEATTGQTASLFDEAEILADPALPEPTVETVTVTRQKNQKGQRKAQLAHLEVHDVEHPADESEQQCRCCQEPMKFVDWQVRQQIDVVPAKAILTRHKQPIYACQTCHDNGEPAPIRTIETMPVPAFPKSLASPSLVAYLIMQKYVLGVPLYRQEQNMDTFDLQIGRQTMANWVIAGASWLKYMFFRIHQILIILDIVHADETKVQVLNEAGRAATTDSTMWLYRSGRDGPPIVLFDYQISRAGEHAKKFLQGFGGYDETSKQITRTKYLQVDGWDAYNCVPREVIIDHVKTVDVILVGCWAHARRKFDEACKVVKPSERKSGKMLAAEKGLKFCNDLYAIEKKLVGASAQQRYDVRREESEPLLAQMKDWLDKMAVEALPKLAFGRAVAYCLNEWGKLTQFLRDGRLEIDNNRAERSIKSFVIGRKNWLFANSVKGAESSAIIYSVVETAKENQLIPFEYLKFLFERLPNIDVKDTDAIDALLPWSETIPNYCRKAVQINTSKPQPAE